MSNSRGLIDLVSLKQQIVNLNKMMKLETLHPDRRQAAQMMSMCLSAKDLETLDFLKQVTLALVSRRPRVSDAPLTKDDNDYNAELQSAWDLALKGSKPDASKPE